MKSERIFIIGDIHGCLDMLLRLAEKVAWLPQDDTIISNSLIPPAHMDFYHSLEMYIEIKDYFIVHAGFRPGVKIKDQLMEDMIWIRTPFIYSDYDFGKKVIFGHTPFPEPLIMENKIGLDTGAFLGNKLTCLELPGMNFYSVKS